MFFPRPPRSVVPTKPVVVQVVQQQRSGAVNPHLLVVEARPDQAAPTPPAPAGDKNSS